MNSKRAKMLRKVAVEPEIKEAVKKYLSNLYRFTGSIITDKQVYKHLKRVDNTMNTKQKERFSANQVQATLS